MANMTKVHAYLLRYTDGSSDKFYNVFFFDRGSSIVHWGRWGSHGQSQTVSNTEAQDRLDQKIRKGYKVEGNPVIEINESQFNGDSYDLMLRAYSEHGRRGVSEAEMAIFTW